MRRYVIRKKQRSGLTLPPKRRWFFRAEGIAQDMLVRQFELVERDPVRIIEIPQHEFYRVEDAA